MLESVRFCFFGVVIGYQTKELSFSIIVRALRDKKYVLCELCADLW